MSSQPDPVTRKVQLTGGSTYTVSLPKEWAADNGLHPGEAVTLHPYANGSLVVEAAGAAVDADAPTRRLSVEGDSQARLQRLLTALYRTGAADVALSGDAASATPDRGAAVGRGLVGFEVSATDGGVAARDVLDDDRVSLSQSLLRLRRLAGETVVAAADAVVAADAEAARGVRDRADDADREFALVERHVQRALTDLDALAGLGCTRPAAFDRYVVARELAAATDAAVRVADAAPALSAPPPEAVGEELLAVADRARSLVESAADAAPPAPDRAAAHDALDAREALAGDVADATAALSGADAETAAHLAPAVAAVERVAERAATVARRGLQAAVRDA